MVASFPAAAASLEGVVVLRVFAGTVAMTVRSGDVFRIVVAFRQEGLFRLFGRRGRVIREIGRAHV